MDFKNLGVEKKVEQVCDEAAGVVKEKVNTALADIGKKGEGACGALSGAGNKAAKESEKAATGVLDAGKKLF